ncbi:MAG: alanine racemase, partial [Gammaproteobacteria bacterium]|nr:alanine racemase [Gemmatimonadota bacterium]NIR40244.1 alanine racemase [Actinomycetota bacterium]NIU78400.1 alanine racemase [Gammaproteobacteria bacterium]
MDLTVVDLTAVDADVDDVVTLVGRDGDDEIRVEDVARQVGTISYEI